MIIALNGAKLLEVWDTNMHQVDIAYTQIGQRQRNVDKTDHPDDKVNIEKTENKFDK